MLTIIGSFQSGLPRNFIPLESILCWIARGVLCLSNIQEMYLAVIPRTHASRRICNSSFVQRIRESFINHAPFVNRICSIRKARNCSLNGARSLSTRAACRVFWREVSLSSRTFSETKRAMMSWPSARSSRCIASSARDHFCFAIV